VLHLIIAGGGFTPGSLPDAFMKMAMGAGMTL
jgi:hypothetical protein